MGFQAVAALDSLAVERFVDLQFDCQARHAMFISEFVWEWEFRSCETGGGSVKRWELSHSLAFRTAYFPPAVRHEEFQSTRYRESDESRWRSAAIGTTLMHGSCFWAADGVGDGS